MESKRGKWTYGKTGEEKSERAEVSGKVEGSFLSAPSQVSPRTNFSLSHFFSLGISRG